MRLAGRWRRLGGVTPAAIAGGTAKMKIASVKRFVDAARQKLDRAEQIIKGPIHWSPKENTTIF
jgi:hypothetical protein